MVRAKLTMRAIQGALAAVAAAATLLVQTASAQTAAQTGSQTAGRQTAVVELYTSQGCSACPPADALLARLAARPGVVALALHVDYWDYLGWRDGHARPEHGRRQKAYGAAMGERMVFTPQMIVNGATSVVGSNTQAVEAALAARGLGGAATLALSGAAGEVVVEARRRAAGAPLDVVAFVFAAPSATSVTRGENAGATLTSVNTVTATVRLGALRAEPARWTLRPPGGADGVAVVAQEAGPGPIHAAAVMALR